MKINLTKKQYWDLLRSLYIADWMANAICDAGMKKDDEIKNIRNYIFSFAKEFGYDDFVEYSDEYKEYFSTLAMDDESSVRELINRYDEHSTWDEFGSWLGERDFYKKYTPEQIEKMTEEERFIKLMECEIAWETEFETYGIERIGIVDMEENLQKWHLIKNNLIKNPSKKVFFHEREIWWCSLGKNVGFEQNGKGEEFTRPVIIVKRLSLDTCLIVPLTTSNKRKNTFSLGITLNENSESFAMVEQVRLVDAKRLGRKIGVLPKEKFSELVDYIKKTNFDGS